MFGFYINEDGTLAPTLDGYGYEYDCWEDNTICSSTRSLKIASVHPAILDGYGNGEPAIEFTLWEYDRSSPNTGRALHPGICRFDESYRNITCYFSNSISINFTGDPVINSYMTPTLQHLVYGAVYVGGSNPWTLLMTNHSNNSVVLNTTALTSYTNNGSSVLAVFASGRGSNGLVYFDLLVKNSTSVRHLSFDLGSTATGGVFGSFSLSGSIGLNSSSIIPSSIGNAVKNYPNGNVFVSNLIDYNTESITNRGALIFFFTDGSDYFYTLAMGNINSNLNRDYLDRMHWARLNGC